MARLGKGFQDVVRIVEGGWHQLGRFHAGITEHDALIARPFILVARRVHALGDVLGLLVDEVADLGGLPVKAVLLVTDFANGLAGDLLDQLRRHRGWTAYFTGEHDLVGGRKRLAGNTRIGIGGEVGVDNRIGDAIADLVRMSFGNGFAGEQIRALLGQEPASSAGDCEKPALAGGRKTPLKTGAGSWSSVIDRSRGAFSAPLHGTRARFRRRPGREPWSVQRCVCVPAARRSCNRRAPAPASRAWRADRAPRCRVAVSIRKRPSGGWAIWRRHSPP